MADQHIKKTIIKIILLSMVFIVPTVIIGCSIYLNTISFNEEFTLLIDSYSNENDQKDIKIQEELLDEIKITRLNSIYTGHQSMSEMLLRFSYYYMFAEPDNIVAHQTSFEAHLRKIKASNYNESVINEFIQYLDSIWNEELNK